MEKLLRQSLIEDQANYEEKIFSGRRFSDLQKYIHKIKGSRQFPKKMHLDDITATEDSTKAELFNKYFASTFQPNDKHISSSIPQSSTSSSRTRQKLCTKFVASETKIHDILQKLHINKAPGHDGIGNVVLKNLSDTLPKSLSLLFQTCIINKATFPSPWKTCKVTPIFKEGNKASVDCYRPISLLCSVSKVLEKLIFDTVYQHVEDMLTDCQYGFRKKRSTVLQMIVFLKEVYELYDSQSIKNLSILYLDFSKAFDKVPHNRLLQKLYDIGIQGKIFDLIKDYLTARTQFVKIRESSSSPLNVTSGVPQGSILGPLLFIIFVNDLPDCAKHSSCYGYCDDMKLLYTTPEGLQQDVKQLENWCLDNSMVLNSKKCNILNIKGECNILLFNSQLQTTNVHRDLGVQVTGSLSWSPNCESRVQSSLRSFYQIKRNVSSKTSLKSKIDLYCGYIVPIVTYASQAWYANKSEMQQLERVQRKASAWILQTADMEYSERLKKIKLLPLSVYMELHDILFFFAVSTRKYDWNLEDHVERITSKNTRQASRGELQIPKTRLKKSEENFWIRAYHLYNIFSHLVEFNEHDQTTLKNILTSIYWRYFDKYYNESNTCTWRILCICGGCNPPGKLLNLAI